MRIPRHRLSSLLFGLSAVGPIGVWLVMLFAAIPASQEPIEHAASLITYVFAESESPWFFVLLVSVPALLLALAVVQWMRPPTNGAKPNWIKWGGVVATLASIVVCWPVALLQLRQRTTPSARPWPNPRFERTHSIWLLRALISFWTLRS